MPTFLKRLWLGLTLIFAVSAILIGSDLRSRRTAAAPESKKTARVAFVKHASNVILDEIETGVLQQFKSRGYRLGENIQIDRFSAEGDIPTGNAIAERVANGDYPLIMTASTLSLQAVANANRDGRAKHVFAGVTDPPSAGVGIRALNSLNKPAHLTGFGTFQPVEKAFRAVKEFRPELKRIGTVWNPAESNAEACVTKARAVAPELGLTLIEASIDQAKDVTEAVASVISRGAEAIWTGYEVTATNAIDALVSTASKAGIPVFSNTTGHYRNGTLFDVGANYTEVGEALANLAVDVLEGRNPAETPVVNFMPERLILNKKVLDGLREHWDFTREAEARAQTVVQKDGTESRTEAKGEAGLTKKARIELIRYSESTPAEEATKGFETRLQTAGLLEGKHFVLNQHSAQGDMPTLNSIFDAVVSDKPDLYLLLSTPTLQIGTQRISDTPIVFTFVADPIVAGAGTSDTDHLPNVTGVYTVGPYAEMTALLKEHFPSFKKIGTTFCPAESNSVFNKTTFEKELSKVGLTLVAVPANGAVELPDASLALAAQHPDAIVQVIDNQSASGFSTIARAAQSAGIPVFAFVSSALKEGAVLALARDYFEAGSEAAEKALEILRGTSPAEIPFSPPKTTKLVINEQNAPTQGFSVPQALLQRAEGNQTGASPAKAAAGDKTSGSKSYRIGFAYYAPEEGVVVAQQGVLDALRELGFEEGKNLEVRRAHATGEINNIPTVLQNFDNSDLDLIVTFTTPVLSAATATVRRKPVIFTYTTDPIGAGVGKSFTNHNPMFTGVGSFPPLEETLALISEMLPQFRRLGLIYSSGEANSRKVVGELRKLAPSEGLNLVEVTAETTSEVTPAMQALLSKDVDAVYIPGDNIAYQAYDAVVKATGDARKPLFIDIPEFAERGAVAGIGPGFYEAGKRAAPMIAEVLRGTSPASIPIVNHSVKLIRFNDELVRKLGLKLPRESSANSAEGPKVQQKKVTKKWNVSVVQLLDAPAITLSREGVRAGLKEAGLVEGQDYSFSVLDAQGEIASLGSMVDAAISRGSDMLVTVTTPALQTAMAKVTDRPVIFTLAVDPLLVGDDGTHEKHRTNVAGVYDRSPFEGMVKLLKEIMPGARAIGTLYAPAEVNSRNFKEQLEEVGRRAGLTVISLPSNSPSEVNDAALALMQRGIDAVVQINDNLHDAAFPTISRAAASARLPIFSFSTKQAEVGASLALANDHSDGGRESGLIAAAVMRGGTPADFPYRGISKTKLVVNLKAAKNCGLAVPESVTGRADQLIKD